MNLTRYDAAYALVRKAMIGELDLEELESALIDLSWGVHPDEDPNLYRIVAPMLLVLAEYGLDHQTRDSVLEVAREVVRNQTIELTPHGPTLTGATNRTFREHLTV